MINLQKIPKIYFASLLQQLFICYIFLCAFLPSGSVLGVNVKMILFSLIVSLTIPLLITKKLPLSVYFSTLFFLLIFAFYVCIGLLHGYEIKSVLLELKFIIAIFSMVMVGYILYCRSEDKVLLLKKILLSSIYGSLCFSVIKSFYFIALYFGYYTYSYMTTVIYPAINYTPVGLSISTGGSRLSFVTLDFLSIVIFVLYIYFRLSALIKLPRVIECLYITAIMISIYSAYSRFLFIIFPILLFVVLILLKKKMLIAFILLISLLISIIYHNEIILIIQQRFINQEHSDSWRFIMINTLLNHWAQSPFLGRGIGAYAPELIRDKNIPFSYEVQYLSLLMQFGALFVIGNFVYFFILIRAMLHSNKLFILLFFITLCLIIGAMTNQYLLSTTMGVLYVLFMLMIVTYSKPSKAVCS